MRWLINSIAVNWLWHSLIEVEVDINAWLPNFTIVWLPDQWIQESKERIRSALRASGTKLPQSRIIVNLAPADIRKSGPSFDFPIAIGILYNDAWIKYDDYIKDSVFIWELSLDWKLRRIPSILPATIWAKESWFKRIFLPKDNANEASIIPWIEIIWIESLNEAIAILNKKVEPTPESEIDFVSYQNEWLDLSSDFKYIVGQEHAKRALEIAAAWGHNIILDWPPGSWKTMLSKAFSGILPSLTIEESIEISKIYSVSGLLSSKNPIITKRPFRTVHHTASSASIIGWGRNAKPWEISLAHKWVLFLDEILEFKRPVLEVLRQPIEDWFVTVNRVNATYEYPSQFILVASMNPCPCGYLTDNDKDCICTPNQVSNYRNKLSWPLLDRVDMFIEVPKVETEKLKVWAKKDSENSFDIKARVESARWMQLKRFEWTNITFNSEMWTREIDKYCILDDDTDILLRKAVSSMNLSARGYYRILKLSRTIADLKWNKNLLKEDVLEALSYRKQEN